MTYKLNFVDNLPEEIEDVMSKDLVEYERNRGIDVNYKRFSIVLTDKTDEPIGVLNAFTAFSEVYIDDLWVHSSHRKKGYGRQGFNNINLVTSAFQAPEFYEKCGFIAEFVRVNKVNPKLTKTFFVKYFKNETQTQGLFKMK